MPASESHPILAREGWGHIVLALLAAIIVTSWAGWLWALPFWIFTLFVLQFFRDPKRIPPDGAGQVLSAADGKVVYVGPATDPYLNRPALKISVFMNVFSVHSNRAPADGVVKELWYRKGKFLNAALDKASEENERNALWISAADSGDDIVAVQVAGLIARRILCYVKAGDQLSRGRRYGFIRFGSRVDHYLPESYTPGVQLGDKITGGIDVIGYTPDTKRFT